METLPIHPRLLGQEHIFVDHSFEQVALIEHYVYVAIAQNYSCRQRLATILHELLEYTYICGVPHCIQRASQESFG